MTEDELQAAILSRCDDLGLFVHHSTDSRRDVGVGFPDLVIAGPGGHVFAELKAGKQRPSPQQRQWLTILQMGGATSLLWRPRDWADGTIQKWLLQLATPVG